MEDEIVAKAIERGYTSHNHTADHRRRNFIREDGVGLIVYPQSEEFEIYYNVDLVVSLQGGKCGSFMNDKHFSQIEAKVAQYAYILRNYKNVMQEVTINE